MGNSSSNPNLIQTPLANTQIPVKKQTLVNPESLSCKHCKSSVADSFYFCPNCGKKIKEPPFKFSVVKTAGLIIFSLILPPLGLVPGIKYLFKKEVTAKLIGIILIVISVVATLIVTMYLINTTNQMFKIYSDLNQMQGTPIDKSEQELTPENVFNQLNALEEISR